MRISDWSSDVCSSDLVLRAAIEGEHHRVARDHLEIFAADPGGAYRDRRSQDRLQHDFAVPRHREDKQQDRQCAEADGRSEEHTSELQSLMRISYAGFCLKKKNIKITKSNDTTYSTNTAD